MTNLMDQVREAIDKNDAKSLKKLLSENPGIANTDPGWFQTTPLATAVRKHKVPLVKILFEHGASIEFATQCGDVLVHNAALHFDNPELMQLLLDNGANVDEFIKGEGTPLRSAALSNNYEVMRLLIQYGADVDHRDNGLTTLEVLISEKNKRAARIAGFGDLNGLLPRGSHHFKESARMLILAGATFPEGARTRFDDLERYKDKVYKEIEKKYDLQNEEAIRAQLKALFISEKTNTELVGSFFKELLDKVSSWTKKPPKDSSFTQFPDSDEEDGDNEDKKNEDKNSYFRI